MSAEREALEKEVAELQKELAKVESDRDGRESAQKDLRVNIDRRQKALTAVSFSTLSNVHLK
jgi:predicted  nucleic acid-binding Zn-ribbon protein